MRNLAIITRPWMCKVKADQCIPRVLADDLTIFCTGHDCAIVAAKALLITHEYILDTRGHDKVETTWSFAKTQRIRELLRLVRFSGSDAPRTICLERRDLGGHIESTLRGRGMTLTHRMQNTIKEVNGTHAVYGGPDQRGRLIRGKYMLQALYSCDTTSVNQTALNHLTAAFVNFSQGHNSHNTSNQRSITLKLTAHQPKSRATNDPNHPLLNSRISRLRRAWYKNLPLHPFLTDLCDK